MTDNGPASRIVERLKPLIDVEEAPGDWFLVRQEDINAFADVTRDQNYLHVDPERAAKESRYKTTIAHGFFTISLFTELVKTIPSPDPASFSEVAAAINYAIDRLRFISPVKVGSRIRIRRTLTKLRRRSPGIVQTTYDITVEIEGERKPACTAIWSTLLVCEGF